MYVFMYVRMYVCREIRMYVCRMAIYHTHELNEERQNIVQTHDIFSCKHTIFLS